MAFSGRGLSLLFLCFLTGNRGPLNVTIVQVGKGNGGGADGGSDLLKLEPPSDLRPTPSPLSDTSTTLQSDNIDAFSGGEAFYDYCSFCKGRGMCLGSKIHVGDFFLRKRSAGYIEMVVVLLIYVVPKIWHEFACIDRDYDCASSST